MAWLNGLDKYAPDGCWLKSIRRTVTEILRREEEFVDMSNEDKETISAGQDFREMGTVGTAMETLGHRFTAKVAVIETYEE